MFRTLRGDGDAAGDKIVSAGTPPERPQKPHIGGLKITPDGTLIYNRIGWEAPPVAPGYRRQSSDLSSDGAWVLEPLNTLCKHLELSPAEMGACGYHRVVRRCKLAQSFIGQRTCGTCPKKEVADARKTK